MIASAQNIFGTESSVSAIVEVRPACSRMGRIIGTCNVYRRTTWTKSSVLMLGDIVESSLTPCFDWRVIYNFGIISASLTSITCAHTPVVYNSHYWLLYDVSHSDSDSLIGKFCDLLRLTCIFFADLLHIIWEIRALDII